MSSNINHPFFKNDVFTGEKSIAPVETAGCSAQRNIRPALGTEYIKRSSDRFDAHPLKPVHRKASRIPPLHFLKQGLLWPRRFMEARKLQNQLAVLDARELADIGLNIHDIGDLSALPLGKDPSEFLNSRRNERRFSRGTTQ